MKSSLGFGDLDLIDKVSAGLKLPNWSQLSALYLMNQSGDFEYICIDITLGHDEELIRFCWTWSYFQGHCGT